MIAGLLVSTLIAFGATSGKPSVSETADALRALRAAGVGGYMIYPRSGLGYEYMSDEWLDYVEGVVGAAENLGMEIWLYDEFNWPSGSCKGQVSKENPEWAYSEYEVERQEDGSFVWRVVRDPDFGANNYSREAMDRFRALTHEKYERRLKRHFGKTIRGIMTDEPAHYSLARRRAVAARRKATGRQIDHFRWWKECEEDYRKASGGRDFRADAEEWYRGEGDGSVWKTYTGNLARRFIAAHFEPTRKWCERNGLEFTGHLIAEQNAPVSAENNGLPVEVLASLSVPGMDEIYSRTDKSIEWLTFHLMEQAVRKNGRGGLVELFAMGPCDMTWEHMLKMIRIAAAHGADRYLLSLHQLNALGYTDPTKWWAMFVSPTQPWFTQFSVFAAEAERMSSFARKTPRYDVAVRYPERAFGVAARCKSIGRKYAVTDLGALLRELETAGYAVRLVGEDETTDLPIVTSLDEARRCAQPSGKPGCLTRRYEDGSCLEVPLAETNGNARVQTRPLETAWRLAADRPVLSRIRFTTNGVARIRLKGPERVRFAIRRAPGRSCTVRLDGSPLEVRKDGVDDLPFAYRGLYGETEALALGSGVREMRLTEGRDDCFYLPALWMIRDFSPDCMDDFVGRLTYSAAVEVPAEAVELRLETGGAVSSVAVDDEDLGARGWSPFVWKVPPTLRGRTVDLRIDLWTSVRPAFGREDVPDAHPVGKLDESFPAARLHKAEWILEEGQVGQGFDWDTRPWIINWWQGMDVEESGLARQFDAFCKAGFGGVRVVPVYGLKAGGSNEVKYLSPEGNRRLAIAQRLARERGLGFEAAGGPGFTFGDASIRPVGGFRRPLKCVSKADAGWMINPFDTGSMTEFLALWEALPFKPAGMFHDSYDYRGAETDGDCGTRLAATFGEWTDWCRRQGVRSRYQAHGSPGDWLGLYALADIPETEMLGAPNDMKIILAKFASSAAHAGGKRVVSGETGTWRGEHFTVSLADLKQSADAMFVAGVNEIVFHGCCYSPEDEAWPGRCFYAASEINPRNPIWKHIDALNGYVTRVQRLLRQCEPDNDVMVVWPVADRLRSFVSAERARMTMNNAAEWCFSQPFGQEALRLWREGYSFDFTSSGSSAPISVPRREPFGAARGLWYVRLKRSDETVYFIVNASSRPVRGEFLPTAVAEGRRYVEVNDPWTGRSVSRTATQKGVSLSFNPQASVFLICRSTAPVRVPKPREVTVIDLGHVNGSARVSVNGHCIGTVIQHPYEIEVPDGLPCQTVEEISVDVVTVAANRIRALDAADPGWKNRYDGHPVLAPNYKPIDPQSWREFPSASCDGPIVIRKEIR